MAAFGVVPAARCAALCLWSQSRLWGYACSCLDCSRGPTTPTVAAAEANAQRRNRGFPITSPRLCRDARCANRGRALSDHLKCSVLTE